MTMHTEYANKAKSTFTKTLVKVLKIIGTALAITNGFIQPLSALVYGELTDELMVPSGAVNTSPNNTSNNTTRNQNSTNSLLSASEGSQVSSVAFNNTGETQMQSNTTNSLQTNNLQSSPTSNSGNISQKRIPTRLVLTPDTNPLYPPGYGYPIMPGLIRLQPPRSKNSTKPKRAMGLSPADQERKISKYAMYYCYLAVATFICSYGQMLCWNIASSKFFQEKKSSYVELEEEDSIGSKGNNRVREQDEEEEADDGIGGRIAVIIQNVANFASSMLVSFIQNWQLTLMMLAAGPIMASVMFYMNKLKSFAMNKVKFLLQKAKGVAKGAFSQVQTVAAFGGQDFEKNKFSSNLLAADKAAKIRSIVDAVRAGLMIVIAFIFLGAGFWFSAGLILDGTLTPGAFISIFMAIISSVLKLVNVGDTVKVDNAKDDKQGEKSMFGAGSDGDNQQPENDIIGKILEHLTSPEEVFKYYPKRPESMVKSDKGKHSYDTFYIEFATQKQQRDRSNMSEKNVFGNSLAGESTERPKFSDKGADTRSFPTKFKEKIKTKFQSKVDGKYFEAATELHKKTKYESINTSDQEPSLKTKCSVEDIKKRFIKSFQNAKSWLETKVIGRAKERGMSMEMIKLQIKQLPLIVLSLVGAVMTGMIAPGFALLLSEILIVTADPKRLEAERYKWAFKFVDLGVFIAIGSTVQKFATSLSESRLEMGMKENAFNSAMDESEVPKTTNSTQLSPTISLQSKEKSLDQKFEDCQRDDWETMSKEDSFDSDDEFTMKGNKMEPEGKDLNLLDGTNDTQAEKMTETMDVNASKSLKSSFSLSDLTSKASSSVSTIMTMFISFTNGWKMTLVVLAGLPIIAYAQSVQSGESEEKSKEESDEGMISKLWNKLRGLTSSASSKMPGDYTSKYKDDCMKPYRYVVKMLIATGLAFAIAECVTFLVYAGALRYGGYLVRVGEMTVESVMTVLMTVLFGGAGSSNAPAEKSKTNDNNSGNEKVDDVKVNDISADDKPIKAGDVKGEVEFHNVEFHHPEKKSVLMSGLNMSVQPSETLAIVGTTDFNCNSLIALIERFYDPAGGYITLDNVDFRNLDVRWLRSQMALVSERGILNHHSVADNLVIGDSTKDLTSEYLEDISRATHLDDFINSLPKSYDSLIIDDVVLDNETKQKLAIARALIRDPRIVIIDEFSQCTADVQDSLRRLCLGRTCIVFARNLSTVEKADKVVIICHGRVVEQGYREELLERRGILYHLMNTDPYSDIAPEL